MKSLSFQRQTHHCHIVRNHRRRAYWRINQTNRIIVDNERHVLEECCILRPLMSKSRDYDFARYRLCYGAATLSLLLLQRVLETRDVRRAVPVLLFAGVSKEAAQYPDEYQHRRESDYR